MAVNEVNEAKRCLQCKNAPCVGGCPIRTPIPEIVRLFNEGRIDEAGKTLIENNPLSLICSRICNQERQCEGHCVLRKKSASILFCSIEHYISDAYLYKTRFPKKGKEHGAVAVIGSGPAGLTVAMRLSLDGYSVTIFEARDRIGGILRYAIPEFRLSKAYLERFKEKLLEMGVKIRPNTTIGGALTIDDLFGDGYDAVFIGTGVWRPKKLGIRGESLGNVCFAIDYLCNPEAYDLGKRLVIIGSGNTAMDVARTAMRKGVSEIRVFAREDKPVAAQREVDYAKADGIQFEFFRLPHRITEQGVYFRPSGTPEPEGGTDPPDASFFLADSVVISISQGPKDKIVRSTKGIEVNSSGLVIIDERGKTSREGIFASGDVAYGGKTVVEAVAHSKVVAESIKEFLVRKHALERPKP